MGTWKVFFRSACISSRALHQSSLMYRLTNGCVYDAQMYETCIYDHRYSTLMHVCMMRICMMHIYDHWSWCLYLWSLIPCLCVWWTYMCDHQYLTMVHICVMDVKNGDERMNGKLNSRSRMYGLLWYLSLYLSWSWQWVSWAGTCQHIYIDPGIIYKDERAGGRRRCSMRSSRT